METNKNTVVKYLNWLAGSINPIDHNEYFNTPRQSDNPLEDIELYLEKKRIDFIKAEGESLLPLLIEIITSPSSVDIPFANYFTNELEAFLKYYKDTPEGEFLKKGIKENFDPQESDHLVKVSLEML